MPKFMKSKLLYKFCYNTTIKFYQNQSALLSMNHADGWRDKSSGFISALRHNNKLEFKYKKIQNFLFKKNGRNSNI
jgi:hypothetical protein